MPAAARPHCILPAGNSETLTIFSNFERRNYVEVQRNYGRQPSNQLRGARGASAHACSTGLSTGRRLMPMTARCGAAALCRGATTVRQLPHKRQVVGRCWMCGSHRARAAAAACETRGNPDRGMPSSAFHTTSQRPACVALCDPHSQQLSQCCAGSAGATVWIATSFRPRPCVFVHTLACQCS